MNKTNKYLLLIVSLGLLCTFFWKAKQESYSVNTKMDTPQTSSIVWAKKISQATWDHSWATWRDFYSSVKNISREEFDTAIKHGEYTLLSIKEFLDLHVENHRLNEYRNATTAEEFYPLENRPRGNTDINSVNYHISLQSPISPICVAKVTVNDTVRYIKLDGVHRLIAASIRKSPIKILFIDL